MCGFVSGDRIGREILLVVGSLILVAALSACRDSPDYDKKNVRLSGFRATLYSPHRERSGPALLFVATSSGNDHGFTKPELRTIRDNLVREGIPILELAGDGGGTDTIGEAFSYLSKLEGIDPSRTGILVVGKAGTAASLSVSENSTCAFLIFVSWPLLDEKESTRSELAAARLEKVECPLLFFLWGGEDLASRSREVLLELQESTNHSDFTVKVVPFEEGIARITNFMARWLASRFRLP
jgi:hypothetical protein